MPDGKQATRDALETAIYALDPASSTLAFRAKAFMLVWVDGTFAAESGTITVSGDRLSAHGVVSAASVNTGIRARDWHLRHWHYLNAKKHPQITLSVDAAPLAGGTAQARLGVRSRHVEFQLELESVQIEDGLLRVRATGSFDRRGLGMLRPLAGVSSVIRVELDVTARRR